MNLFRIHKDIGKLYSAFLLVIFLSIIFNVYLATKLYQTSNKRGISYVQSVPRVESNDDRLIPQSNWEWMSIIAGSDLLKEWEATAMFTGEVASVIQEHGVQDVDLKHYYVGEPGTYEYDGGIDFKDDNDVEKSILFSPRRMAAMKVFKVIDGSESPVKFSDIKPGDKIEIHETVSLVNSNINDENLISLTIIVK